jgi:glycosyltransferase involved in cell wall biosynthesis
MTPKVSIVILSYFHPQVTEICLKTLKITEDIDYEVVVVDNGSDGHTVDFLHAAQRGGYIDTLILEQENHMFSEGNNIGVHRSNQESEYVLLLNSDIGFLRPDWLSKLVGWAEGTTKYWPSIWPFHPTEPAPGPYDVVSLGWRYDGTLLREFVCPEGFCIMYRRSVWQDMPREFPWNYGIDLQLTNLARAGARIGVLSQYGSYLVHREQGSTDTTPYPATPEPQLAAWYDGVHIESLDFTIGPNEHDSYLWW